jgi:hypothetical protein
LLYTDLCTLSKLSSEWNNLWIVCNDWCRVHYYKAVTYPLVCAHAFVYVRERLYQLMKLALVLKQWQDDMIFVHTKAEHSQCNGTLLVQYVKDVSVICVIYLSLFTQLWDKGEYICMKLWSEIGLVLVSGAKNCSMIALVQVKKFTHMFTLHNIWCVCNFTDL